MAVRWTTSDQSFLCFCDDSEAVPQSTIWSDDENPNYRMHPAVSRTTESTANPLVKEDKTPPPDPEGRQAGDEIQLSVNAFRVPIIMLEPRAKTPHIRVDIRAPRPSAKKKRKLKKKKKKKKKQKDKQTEMQVREESVLQVPQESGDKTDAEQVQEIEATVVESSDSGSDSFSDEGLDMYMHERDGHGVNSEETPITYLPSPWTFIGLKLRVLIDRLVTRLQGTIRSFIARTRYLRLRDVVVYAQRMFRTRRVSINYGRVLSLKKSGRSLKLAMKQVEKFDCTAEIRGDGEIRKVVPKTHNVRLKRVRTKKRSISFLRAIEMDEDRRKVWEDFLNLSARLDNGYVDILTVISTCSTLQIHHSLQSHFSYYLNVVNNAEDEESIHIDFCSMDLEDPQWHVGSLKYLELSFRSWVMNDLKEATAEAPTGKSKREMKKLAAIKVRKMARMKSIRNIFLELRDRTSVEYFLYVLSPDDPVGVSGASNNPNNE
ncbi:hypothetical protein HDU96_005776 [Phlyctochytrium bullatum]|nr:hypothetical protein HDU96_005776 [Phlyctochytrium bullatum]